MKLTAVSTGQDNKVGEEGASPGRGLQLSLFKDALASVFLAHV